MSHIGHPVSVTPAVNGIQSGAQQSFRAFTSDGIRHRRVQLTDRPAQSIGGRSMAI